MVDKCWGWSVDILSLKMVYCTSATQPPGGSTAKLHHCAQKPVEINTRSGYVAAGIYSLWRNVKKKKENLLCISWFLAEYWGSDGEVAPPTLQTPQNRLCVLIATHCRHTLTLYLIFYVIPTLTGTDQSLKIISVHETIPHDIIRKYH